MSELGKKLEPPDDSRMLVTMTVGELRQVVSEEVRAALKNEGAHMVDKNRLLSPQQAAEILGQNVRWVYRHAGKLPFTRRVSRKNLRFSEAGLRRWIALRKPDSRR
jgi:predicted DNA-binding transcriptional regulator AlpA